MLIADARSAPPPPPPTPPAPAPAAATTSKTTAAPAAEDHDSRINDAAAPANVNTLQWRLSNSAERTDLLRQPQPGVGVLAPAPAPGVTLKKMAAEGPQAPSAVSGGHVGAHVGSTASPAPAPTRTTTPAPTPTSTTTPTNLPTTLPRAAPAVSAPAKPQASEGGGVTGWLNRAKDKVVDAAGYVADNPGKVATEVGKAILPHDNYVNAGVKAWNGDYAGAWKEARTGLHEGLDVLGFVPGYGAVADGVNAGIYAAEGDWVNAGLSTAAAIPGIGDAGAAINKGRKIGSKVMEGADDVGTATAKQVPHAAAPKVPAKPDAPAQVPPDAPTALTPSEKVFSRITKLESGDPGTSRVVDELTGKARSGTRAEAPRDGQFVPTQTAGAASELRAYDTMQQMDDVQSIRLVPHSRADRSADAVLKVKAADGSTVEKRFEMTTVTVGRGNGYQPTGPGRADPVTRARVGGAIDEKTQPVNQFNADMGGVPNGGYLGIHMRGEPLATNDLAKVVDSRQARLRQAGVEEVWFFRADRSMVRVDVNSGRQTVVPAR